MDNPTLLLQRQRMLLEIEYNHEKEEFRKQTESMGVERKVRRGDAWFPISIGRSYYNSLNQMVVEVMRQPGSDIEHNFEAGRPVCFFTIRYDMGTAGTKATKAGSKLQYLSFTATVRRWLPRAWWSYRFQEDRAPRLRPLPTAPH